MSEEQPPIDSATLASLNHLYGHTRKLYGEIEVPQGRVKVDADVHDSCRNAYEKVAEFIQKHQRCEVRELKPVKDQDIPSIPEK